MNATMRVLDPTPRPRAESRGPCPTLATPAGKVIGFIDNGKPNFHHLVDDLAALLKTRYGVADVVVHRKPGQIAVAKDALDDLVARCDAIVTGSGD